MCLRLPAEIDSIRMAGLRIPGQSVIWRVAVEKLFRAKIAKIKLRQDAL
jgi:hypothetical protein